MKKQQKCYIYTRVSTSMQVEGYSLDAQKDKLKKYADYQEMSIVGEYSDEGKSGKSVEGRPQFKQMLSDIENGKAGLPKNKVIIVYCEHGSSSMMAARILADKGYNVLNAVGGIRSYRGALTKRR